jgi:hypothetical protein
MLAAYACIATMLGTEAADKTTWLSSQHLCMLNADSHHPGRCRQRLEVLGQPDQGLEPQSGAEATAGAAQIILHMFLPGAGSTGTTTTSQHGSCILTPADDASTGCTLVWPQLLSVRQCPGQMK